MQVTADISKISENVQLDIPIIFDAESLIDFVSLLVVLTVENVVVFTKNRFYQKRGCVTMRNYMEMFHDNIGHN